MPLKPLQQLSIEYQDGGKMSDDWRSDGLPVMDWRNDDDQAAQKLTKKLVQKLSAKLLRAPTDEEVAHARERHEQRRQSAAAAAQEAEGSDSTTVESSDDESRVKTVNCRCERCMPWSASHPSECPPVVVTHVQPGERKSSAPAAATAESAASAPAEATAAESAATAPPDDGAYMAVHMERMEAELSKAINSAIAARAADPVIAIAEALYARGADRTAPSPTKPRRRVVEAESTWTVKSWLDGIDLAATVADALQTHGEQPTALKALERADVERMLSARGLSGMTDVVESERQKLRAQAASTGAELNSKFQANAQIVLAYGTLDTFYQGLEGSIGPPLLVDGSLLRTIEMEHTERGDCHVEFLSSNGMSTTSAVEFEFVHAPREGKPYPDRDDFRAADHPHRRRAWSRHELEEAYRPMNEALGAGGHTTLILEEAIGARLYTGSVNELRPVPQSCGAEGAQC